MRVLPLAPRPFDDELLSSWQGRVACRYGCTLLEVESWLDADIDPGRRGDLIGRDFDPGDAMITRWARACRMDAGRLARMALRRQARGLNWYIQDRWHQGVCSACLDEDHAGGRDHYLRRAWSRVEAIVCPRHLTMLRDLCGHCFARTGFRFDCREGRGRLVCRSCSAPVSFGRANRVVSERQSFLLALTDIVTLAIEEGPQGTATKDIMRAARLLWSSSQAGGKPFIAWLGHPRLNGNDMPADREEPLATASLPSRMLTLFGIAQLLDLADARSRIGPPPFFLAEKFAAGDLSRSATGRVVPQTRNVERPATTYAPRSDAEYRTLAEEILASPQWRAVQGAARTVRERALARLMTEALDRAPRDRAAGLDPAAP
ncbi:TniQ family protein (plasmid) [Mesorhizobium sp. AR07]|uniref:TniQ family protein n=1 Tax=Mesorhizobium sp. AR07 TaxID=2865838 RepID=UPI00215E3BF4|nr:TniQ family protein [Mesorhizobium sp. AR07]UVK49484.1 TniQ family protein [Mesorhizobium sp. AR07]